MIKILLVRTKSEKYDRPYGAPPLGLLYLAACLREKTTCEVKIIDMRSDMLTPADGAGQFVSFSPNVVGISGFTVEVSSLHKVAAVIKEKSNDCPIVVGGPHVNACPEEVLSDQNIDYLVLGEGERTFPEFVEALLHPDKDLTLIPGMAFRSEGRIKKTAPRECIANLDELPFPAWDLVEIEKYYRLPRFMPFIPNRGILRIFFLK